MGASRQGDLLGAVGMNRIEALAAAFGENADQIDQHAGIARGGGHRGGVAQIGLDGVDLADPTERLEEIGEFGPAHRYPDAVMALGQCPDDVAAEEARAAINGDEGVGGAACGHAALDLTAEGRFEARKYRIGPRLYRGP